MPSFYTAYSRGYVELKKSLMALKNDSEEATHRARSSTKTNGLKTTGEGRRIPTTTTLLFALVIVIFVLLGLDTSCLSKTSLCTLRGVPNGATWLRKSKIASLPDIEDSPKVALLFLASRGLPHEPLWRAFFERAAKLSFRHPPPNMNYFDKFNKEQKELLKEINNSIERKLLKIKNPFKKLSCLQEEELLEGEVNRLMKASEHSSKILSQQSLFSVYVHPSRGAKFPENHTFYGTEIPRPLSLKNAWGKFRLVQAELRLLEAALKEKRNKKFVLLSESCIPLYPPEVIYSQFLSEQKSRMRSCPERHNVAVRRYREQMTGKYFNKSDWRKNKQWFALNRAHAKVIVEETYLKNRFKEWCSGRIAGDTICAPDEHYIATALFVYKFGNETDCVGEMTAAEFHGTKHPRTYLAEDITQELLQELRGIETCPSIEAITSAAAIFSGAPTRDSCFQRNLSSLNIKNESDSSKEWVIGRGYRPLNTSCHLFARKFSLASVRETLRVSLACGGGSLGYWC